MDKEALATAVKLDPELAEAYTNLGIALQDLGEGEEAERMTGMAVRIKPDMAAGHNNHGRALENNKRLCHKSQQSTLACTRDPAPDSSQSSPGALRNLWRANDGLRGIWVVQQHDNRGTGQPRNSSL